MSLYKPASSAPLDALKKPVLLSNAPSSESHQLATPLQPTVVPMVAIQQENKIIESLALLNNHKEHERADPVLQSSMPADMDKVSVENGNGEALLKKTLPETGATTTSAVPASSREFCMNLNFNLAAAAAVFSAAPIAISG